MDRLAGNPLVLGAGVEQRVDEVVSHLLATGLVDADGELPQVGPEAERRYRHRNYLELSAVFADPPTLSVVHGRTTLARSTSAASSVRRADGAAVLLLAGCDWHVEHIDWRRRTVAVTPAGDRWGRAQWLGAGPGQSAVVARATWTALAGRDPDGVILSRRAQLAAEELRERFDWLRDEPSTVVVQEPKGAAWWWTFAGTAANTELAAALGGLAASSTSGLAIRLGDGTAPSAVSDRLHDERPRTLPPLPEDLAEVYKFADALPAGAAQALFDARERDPATVEQIIHGPLHAHRLPFAGPPP